MTGERSSGKGADDSSALGYEDTVAGAESAGQAATAGAADDHPMTAQATSTDAGRTSDRSGSATDGLHPGMLLGHYELIRKLGRGGMGAVYLARDTLLGRRVAIKFLAHDNPNLSRRFLAEARATARCKHDNIVVIHEVGEEPGLSYMVLEYVEGVTLRSFLKERWPSDDAAAPISPPRGACVSPARAVELIIPVVRALAHAHKLGLVHRDLKPENVMLTEDGAIKVLDFGLAKVLDDVVSARSSSGAAGVVPSMVWAERGFETRAGDLLGTVPYMSPEQWGADDIDDRCDLWAAGIMLWELCTGRHPLAPLTRERLSSIARLDVPMPAMSDKHPHLGPLTRIVDRCLRKRRDERMPSAAELLSELQSLPASPDESAEAAASVDRSDSAQVVPAVALVPAASATPALAESAPLVGSSGQALAVRSAGGLAPMSGKRRLLALMGGVSRRGPWSPSDSSRVYAVMGGVELDFREAELPPGVTDIKVRVFMGHVEIIVPPEVDIEADGLALMGGFGEYSQTGDLTNPDRPILRITGFSVMGGVSIDTRLPGESQRDARRRRKRERKERRAKK